jgi:Ca-activated chloride channel family protein
VFLSVLGVGTGNLKDSTMEMLADKGNGHYAYLDSLQEARRVLVREGGATPETVAKDVKFQVEFHPAQVAAWRLIGYENRQLAHQDFNNDKKDGGELGAGHSVTVLYEIVPVGVPFFPNTPESRPAVDPLRYQPGVGRTEVRFAGSGGPETGPPYVRTSAYPEELLTVKIRYKQPDGDLSELMEQPIRRNAAAPHVAFAAAVAEFGLLLRDAASPATRWDLLAARVNTMSGAGTDAADRQSFRDLVELAAGLKRIR